MRRKDNEVSKERVVPVETPVVLLVFNRPDLTTESFQHIRRARPRTLLVVADGPRPGRSEDVAACREARAVTEVIDWPCHVVRRYVESNLGCGLGPAEGVTWAFEHVDRAIIMEDDCRPARSLFAYCDALLDRYADDPRVMHVNCCNFLFGAYAPVHSYYFSKYPHGQIWATWRRAWSAFDYDMAGWPEFRTSAAFRRAVGDRVEADYWRSVLDRAFEQDPKHYWDYQWLYACWSRGGLSVTPRTNLVSNLGFRPDGTHVTGESPLANMPIVDLADITHPPVLARSPRYDRYVFDHAYGGLSMRAARSASRRLRGIIRKLRDGLIGSGHHDGGGHE